MLSPLAFACNFARRFGSHFFATLIFFVSTVTVIQSQTNTDGYTPTGLAPGAPAGSYALNNSESINLFNGNLGFNLPLLNVGGRGTAGYTVLLPIEQKWRVNHNWEFGSHTAHPGWWTNLDLRYNPGGLQGRSIVEKPCYSIYDDVQENPDTITRFTFITSDGTELELIDELTGGNRLQSRCYEGSQLQSEGASRGRVFISKDGSFATFVSDTNIRDVLHGYSPSVQQPSGLLSFRDGTQYRIDSGRVTAIRDRNGNRLSFTYTANGFTANDSNGRQVTVSYNVADVAPYGLCDKITFTGFGGAQQVIRISKTTLDNVLRPDNSVKTYSQLFPGLSAPSGDPVYNDGKVSAVWLPDNRNYRFYYNSYGELARVVLPTGGAYEYDWEFGMWAGGGNDIYRRVVSRRVYPDGVTLDGVTSYSIPASTALYEEPSYVVVQQFNSTGNPLGLQKHFYHGSAEASLIRSSRPYATSSVFISGWWKEGKEFRTENYASNGTTLLKRVDTVWSQSPPPSWSGLANEEPNNNPRIVEGTTTFGDTNQVAKQMFGYDEYNNRTSVEEYAFGIGAPGVLMRRSTASYLHQTNPNYANNTNIHLRSLPTQTSVFDNGVEQARTTFEYDNYASDTNRSPLLARNGISGMDVTCPHQTDPD